MGQRCPKIGQRKSLLKNFPEKNGPNYLRMEQERRADVREAGDGQRFLLSSPGLHVTPNYPGKQDTISKLPIHTKY